jgi:hypothetical protein
MARPNLDNHCLAIQMLRTRRKAFKLDDHFIKIHRLKAKGEELESDWYILNLSGLNATLMMTKHEIQECNDDSTLSFLYYTSIL